MLNILFWNLNRNDIEDYIAECIGEHEIDIAVFAEYEGVKFPSLERKLGGKYTRITGIESDKKVTLVAKKTLAIRNRFNEVGKKVGKKVGNSDVDRPILNPRRQTKVVNT